MTKQDECLGMKLYQRRYLDALEAHKARASSVKRRKWPELRGAKPDFIVVDELDRVTPLRVWNRQPKE